jgi:retron-type reverse transcriptase
LRLGRFAPVLEPIFEADLEPAAFGYRPGSSATGAIQAVLGLRSLPLRRR